MIKQDADNERMDWKKLIEEIQGAGMSQSAIGESIGKSQAWVSAVLKGHYGDLKWSDGEALRGLHTEKVGAGETVKEVA